MTDTKPPPRERPSTDARTRPHDAPPPREDARIAKVMARAGLCSRRDAEVWIAAGRVAVNGAVIASPALNVSPNDRITVDGLPLPEPQSTRLFMFHKPRGLVTTDKDPEGRQTIFDVLPPELPRVVTVGRLDINTEGLLLLTNDGGLARTLELPSTGWLRRYRVRANGEILQPALDALAAGITIEGVDYAGIEATLDRVQGSNVWLTMGLREGKNREIKRVLEHLGLAVNRLIRVSFGPFHLGELPDGRVEEIRPRVMLDQLGPALAAKAGIIVEDSAPPPRRRARDDRGEGSRTGRSPPEPSAPRQSQPKTGPRAHVSVLRAAREEAQAGEARRRTRRGSTADRKGRAVAVERVSSTAPARPPATNRNARRFSAGHDGAPQRREDQPRGEKPRRDGAQRGEAPQRRARPERFVRPEAQAPASRDARRAERDGGPPKRFPSNRTAERGKSPGGAAQGARSDLRQERDGSRRFGSPASPGRHEARGDERRAGKPPPRERSPGDPRGRRDERENPRGAEERPQRFARPPGKPDGRRTAAEGDLRPGRGRAAGRAGDGGKGGASAFSGKPRSPAPGRGRPAPGGGGSRPPRGAPKRPPRG